VNSEKMIMTVQINETSKDDVLVMKDGPSDLSFLRVINSQSIFVIKMTTINFKSKILKT